MRIVPCPSFPSYPQLPGGYCPGNFEFVVSSKTESEEFQRKKGMEDLWRNWDGLLDLCGWKENIKDTPTGQRPDRGG